MRTISFKNKPVIVATGTTSGPKEGLGEVGKYIDYVSKDDTFGEKTFEKAETKMLYTSIKQALEFSKIKEEDINAIISGDLLNQIIASTFSARNFNIGFLGVYNACASFTESLILGATFLDGGYFNNVICATSSHFSSAERQYRYPLELGCTRPPLSQWTVTGAGALVLSNKGNGPKIVGATIGKIIDYGVSDTNNMCAAMAPCAMDVIKTHFIETNTSPKDYDLIITGDLGAFGSRLLKDLLWEKGFDIQKQHVDCGELIYNIKEDEFQGGSGAGCSSLVFCSYFYNKLKLKKLNRILLVSTGALLSSVSSQQNETIPGIAHLVEVEC
ncbi:MAG: stage V sporulation protein AD [Clostridia bacterium]|nr:stage V sporulation protein AD [Clostridia bacterium]